MWPPYIANMVLAKEGLIIIVMTALMSVNVTIIYGMTNMVLAKEGVIIMVMTSLDSMWPPSL